MPVNRLQFIVLNYKSLRIFSLMMRFVFITGVSRNQLIFASLMNKQPEFRRSLMGSSSDMPAEADTVKGYMTGITLL